MAATNLEKLLARLVRPMPLKKTDWENSTGYVDGGWAEHHNIQIPRLKTNWENSTGYVDDGWSEVYPVRSSRSKLGWFELDDGYFAHSDHSYTDRYPEHSNVYTDTYYERSDSARLYRHRPLTLGEVFRMLYR